MSLHTASADDGRSDAVGGTRSPDEHPVAADPATSAFLADISHELRGPLSLISAPVSDAVERLAGGNPRVLQDLDIVQAGVARLTRLVDVILDFSRLEMGRVVPHLESTNVAVMVQGLAASFRPAISRAGLDFDIDAEELSRPALVDTDFLERMVLNLLSNAVKFTPQVKSLGVVLF